MSTEQILERVSAKDWSLIEEDSFETDPAAANALVALCNKGDAETRELALFALNATPGPVARARVLKALEDEDINVRSAASRFVLETQSNTDVVALHAALTSNQDELVRENASLALGKIGSPLSQPIVRERLEKEMDSGTQKAMKLALVRLGDEEQKQLFAQRFSDSDPRQRVQALQDFEYVEDQVYLRQIVPLLADEAPGFNVGPSAQKKLIRVCDVAVNVLAAVLNLNLGFELDPSRTYSIDERREVSDVVRSLLGS